MVINVYLSYRKLMHNRPQLWGHQIAVDWAEPEVEVDDDVMAQVKILYVRNLMLNTTDDSLEKVLRNPKIFIRTRSNPLDKISHLTVFWRPLVFADKFK